MVPLYQCLQVGYSLYGLKLEDLMESSFLKIRPYMTLDGKSLKLIQQNLKVPLYDGVECRLALYKDRFIFKTGGCVGDEVFKDVEYFDTASDSDWVSCP